MKIFHITSVVILLIAVCSCGPLEDYRQFTDRDIHPPMFISMGTLSPNTLELQFSELISLEPEYLIFSPVIEIESLTVENDKLQIIFMEDLEPGSLFKIEISVSDLSGNSLTLIADFYGYNSNIPELVINEFTTQGSATNPDKVELRVLSNGNTAGICIYEGIDTEWSQRKVLPAIEVSTDDYIIIHFKPTGTAEEVDETLNTNTSGGLNVHPDAWDIWLEGGSGLSGNNGAITIFTSPRGTLIDAVLYSNRTSSSDESYRGFGSTVMMNKADRLIELGGWNSEYDLISPEDAINPEDSTATRSICRESVYADTNYFTDWHIVPTSTASFGEINSDLIFTP